MGRSRGLLRLAVALALSASLMACNDSDDDRSAPADSVQGDPVQIRRVLATTGQPDIQATPSSSPSSSPTALPDNCSAVPAGQPTPDAEAIACDDKDTVYRLAPADIVGGIESARAALAPNSGGWTVQINFDDTTSRALDTLTTELATTQQQMAMVVEGRVASAAVVTAPITDGKVQIAGDFSQADARKLADALDP